MIVFLRGQNETVEHDQNHHRDSYIKNAVEPGPGRQRLTHVESEIFTRLERAFISEVLLLIER